MPYRSGIDRGLRNGELKEALEESITEPDDRLIKALDKKLSSRDAMLLRLWLRREREETEWSTEKETRDRIEAKD